MIAFSCPNCGMKFKVKTQFAGRSSRCPTCKQALTVPEPERTVAHVPAGEIDGTASSVHQAGVDAGVTLEPAGKGGGHKSIRELLARQAKKGQRYIVESEIARGGMGAVLRAIDRDIRREVAVKFMLDDRNAKKKARFVEEAQITGQLEHPNIVPIHELGVDAKGRLFFSMKMVKGRSLAQVLDELRKNPKIAEKEHSLGRLLNIFVNVCHALAYAHSRGVVHRDLKPANIMLGDFGEVYVMDWGLAKVLKGEPGAGGTASATGAISQSIPPIAPGAPKKSSKVEVSRELDADLTQEGSILGTPVYMPPEQAMGNLGAIDARSDIYSLGAILYEILTLQSPIEKEGGYLAILMRVCEGQIHAPEVRVPERASRIPKELSAVAMKALAKEPGSRYQNVEALRRDIERFLEGHSVSAKQDSFRELAWKLVKRNQAVSAATSVFLVVLVVGAVLAFSQVNQARLRAEEQKQEAEQYYTAYQKEQKEKETRTREAVPALIRAARQLANDGDFDAALRQTVLALVYDPDYAEARLLRGQILIARKEWPAGREELEQFLKRQPDHSNAQRLVQLCVDGKEGDSATLFTVAQSLQREKLYGLASYLLKDVQRTVEGRRKLLPLYRKQIETVWPGLGNRLTLKQNGQFDLYFAHCPQVTVLEPLKGIPLDVLNLSPTAVRDLTPLQGMPLKWLNLSDCKVVRDLTPLHGMPLRWLSLYDCTGVRDLTPLEGMPLNHLDIRRSGVDDVSPLADLELTTLLFTPQKVKKGMSVLRGMETLKTIGVTTKPNDTMSPEEFWKRYDAGQFKK